MVDAEGVGVGVELAEMDLLGLGEAGADLSGEGFGDGCALDEALPLAVALGLAVELGLAVALGLAVVLGLGLAVAVFGDPGVTAGDVLD